MSLLPLSNFFYWYTYCIKPTVYHRTASRICKWVKYITNAYWCKLQIPPGKIVPTKKLVTSETANPLKHWTFSSIRWLLEVSKFYCIAGWGALVCLKHFNSLYRGLNGQSNAISLQCRALGEGVQTN